jgi:hypothetical protein
LLVSFALAGCAGSSTPSTADTATPTASATETPALTPSAPNQTASDRLPAGFNETGVGNVSEATRTHQTQALETPGVVTQTTNSTARGRSVTAAVRVSATADATRVRYVSEAQARTANGTRDTTSVVAANGTSVRQYTVTDGNVTLDNRRNRTELFDRAFRGLTTGTNPLRGTLRRGNFTLATNDHTTDTGAVTFRADRYVGDRLYDGESVVAYNATVRVTADGLIRSATETIVARQNGSESRYRFTYDFAPQSVDLPAVPQVPADIRAQSGAASDE